MKVPGGETGRAANIIAQKNGKNTAYNADFNPADAFPIGIAGKKQPQNGEKCPFHAVTVTFVAQLDGGVRD